MKHARKDYDRIQDPAANPELLVAYNRAMDLVAHGPHSRDDGSLPRADVEIVFQTLSTLCRALSPTLSDLVRTGAPHGTPIAEDEPVFLLRAQDATAPETLQFWASINGKASAIGVAALLHAERMWDWQKARGRKQADAPPEVLR